MATSKRLKNLSKSELKEMLDRQIKILSNKSFITKLPDKGEKIQRLRSHLEDLLAQQDSQAQHDDKTVFEVTNSLQNLRLGQQKDTKESHDLDSDDDEPGASACVNGRLKELSMSETKLTETKEQFFEKLAKKVEPEGGTSADRLYHFRLNRELHSTTVTDLAPTPQAGKPPKMWYETAVTPPPSKFNEAKLIPLKDSFDLYVKHNDTLKDLAMQHVAGQLFVRTDGLPGDYRTQYRESVEDQSSEDD